MIQLVTACLLSTPGWIHITDLPDLGHPNSVNVNSEGHFHVGYVAGCKISDLVLTSNGEEISREEGISPIMDFPEYNLLKDDSCDEPCAAPVSVQCSDAQGIIWSRRIGESDSWDDLTGFTIPRQDGGCFAVFAKSYYQGVWELHSLDDSGGIDFSTTFTISGGPVLAINDMLELQDGGVVLTGVTDDLGLNLYMILNGFDETGRPLFFIRDSLRYHGSGLLISSFPDGSLVVLGTTGDERDDGYFLPPKEQDVFISCYSLQGELKWQTILDYPRANTPTAMWLGENGSVVTVIRSVHESGEGETNWGLFRFSPTDTLQSSTN